MPLSDIHGNCHYVPYCKQITYMYIYIYMVKPNNNKVNHTRVHFRVFHSLALAGRVPVFRFPDQFRGARLTNCFFRGNVKAPSGSPRGKDTGNSGCGRMGKEERNPASFQFRCQFNAACGFTVQKLTSCHQDLTRKLYDSISSANTTYLTNSIRISPNLLRHVPLRLCMLQSRISKFSIMECMV